MTTAMAASIVFATPYPSASYIAGAKSGKPKPASDRKKVTAARAGNTIQSIVHANDKGNMAYQKRREG